MVVCKSHGSCSKVVLLYPIALVVCALLSLVSLSSAGAVYTDVECKRLCGLNSTPAADNFRALGNRVSDKYRGWSDVWASIGAQSFATNLRVYEGQSWPRISEGVVTPHVSTPGYPITVSSYLQLGLRSISYDGELLPRTKGPSPRPYPRGPVYNGAFIRLHRGNTSIQGAASPQPPFSVEITIWNRYDNKTKRGRRYSDYTDRDGTYSVYGGPVKCDIPGFFAYFLLNENQEGMTSMTINVGNLLKHLRDKAVLDESLEIIEIAVAAEGHAGADGMFIADIISMGRP